MTRLKFDLLHRLETDYDREYFEPMQISDDDKARRRELANFLTDAFLYFFSVYEVHKMYNSLLEKALYEQLLTDQISDAVSKVTGIDGEMSSHIRTLAKDVVNTTYKNASVDKSHIGSGQTAEKTTSTPLYPEQKATATTNSNSNPSSNSNSAQSKSKAPEMTLTQDATADTARSIQSQSQDGDADYWLSMKRAMNIAYSETNTFLNYTDYVDAKERGYKYKTWHTMNDPKVRETHEEVEGQTVGIDEFFQVGSSQMKFPHDWSTDPDPAELINCRCSVEYR